MSDKTRTVTREDRRLAVEAFLDAHYDVACDAARELAWFEAHPDQAVAVVAVLAPAALPTSTEELDAVNGCIAIVEQSLATVRTEAGDLPSGKVGIAAREHVIALLTGYRDRLASLSPSPTEENPE